MLLKIIWQAAVLVHWVVDAFNYDYYEAPRLTGRQKYKGETWEYPEKIHNPYRFKKPLSKYVNESEYEVDPDTPDFRIEEFPPQAVHTFYKEHHRPFRLSPHYKQTYKWRSATSFFFGGTNRDYPDKMGGYCCTVFKRLTPLAACAVITTRHILTTATSTELVLKEYGKNSNLENILGAWYDTNQDNFNSSMYMTPCRIHYHPRFLMPDAVNVSHPLPYINDLAVWASTYPFHTDAVICQRAGSFWRERGSPVPGVSNPKMLVFVVGFQFMWGYKRVPAPWFKYAIKTKSYLKLCPKNEWGWFFCLMDRFAPLGIDSGAALHRSNQNENWMYDGLLGMGAFSMTLRSTMLTHYFTPVENYDVLDWLYQAYMGRVKYRYLDRRFYDTQWKAPLPKPWFYIPFLYVKGEERNYDDPPQWNK